MSNKPLSLLIKPSSSLCNMRCKYCFYHSLAEARESYSHGVMTNETADILIDRAFEFVGKEPISFAFQGGEPLISGLPFFKHFVDKVNQKNINGNKLFFSLQTNGTLIDDDWATFFKANNFLIGLSLDGNQKANRQRRLNDDSFAYGEIMNGVDILTKHGVDFNILCVLTRDIANNIEEVYNFFKEKGFKYLQFTPYIRPFGNNDDDPFHIPVNEYADYLIRLFNLYVKDYVRGNYISIRHLDNFVQLYLGRSAEQCGMNGYCSHHYVIEGNGDVYPCDFYCLDEYLLGNINTMSFDELEHCKTAVDFINESITESMKCKDCKYFKLCFGGCKRNRADTNYCEAYKTFFNACLPLFRVFINE